MLSKTLQNHVMVTSNENFVFKVESTKPCSKLNKQVFTSRLDASDLTRRRIFADMSQSRLCQYIPCVQEDVAFRQAQASMLIVSVTYANNPYAARRQFRHLH